MNRLLTMIKSRESRFGSVAFAAVVILAGCMAGPDENSAPQDSRAAQSAVPVCGDGAAMNPIGVFDSGVGGLTVLDKLLSLDRVNNTTGALGSDGVPDFEGESFTFLGDQANFPYGNYAAQGGSAFLRELAIRDAFFLLSCGYYRSAAEEKPAGKKKPAKIVVIACNTATAYGLSAIDSTLRNVGSPVKVIGVVNAGSRAALARLQAGPESAPFSVGVMSTPGTFASGAYPRAIAEEAARRGMKTQPRVVARGCADLADAIELGLPKGETIAHDCFVEIVEELRAANAKEPLRALIFGCTHYPFLQRVFDRTLAELRADPKFAPYVADDFMFVDPAVETAAECYASLAADGLLAHLKGPSSVAAYVSVPCASLEPSKVGKDGTLAFEYKYSRRPGRDVVDSKFVPLALGTVDRAPFYRLVQMLPAVRRYLEPDN